MDGTRNRFFLDDIIFSIHPARLLLLLILLECTTTPQCLSLAFQAKNCRCHSFIGCYGCKLWKNIRSYKGLFKSDIVRIAFRARLRFWLCRMERILVSRCVMTRAILLFFRNRAWHRPTVGWGCVVTILTTCAIIVTQLLNHLLSF